MRNFLRSIAILTLVTVFVACGNTSNNFSTLNSSTSESEHDIGEKNKMTVHCIVEREKSEIALEEWILIAQKFSNIHITDKLKQQNPFTNEFVEMDVLGSGYWEPNNVQRTEFWPFDGTIVFRYMGGRITFIQFNDASNLELKALANELDAKLVLENG